MEHFDIAIIGTGSGNSILDERYTDKRVAICEQGTFGGTCLNVGCIPTKMFVYAAEVAENARDAARFGVDVTVDGVRWSDIVSRVFGRIDPIAMGGENYRRVVSECLGLRLPYPLRTNAIRWPLHAAHRWRRRVHRGPGGDRRRLARDGARCDQGLRRRLPHQRHHHADRRIAEAFDHRRWRVRRRGVRAHLLVARHAGHADHPQRHNVAALRRLGV